MTPAAQGLDVTLIWLIAGWAVLGVGAALLLWALFRDRARGRRRCPRCWYDMKGVPGLRCPECGQEAKTEKRLLRTRRRWGWAGAALVLVCAGWVSTRVPTLMKDGVIAAIPTPALRFAAWTQRARAKELFENLMTPTPAQSLGSPLVLPRTPRTTKEWDTLILAWHAGGVLADATPADRSTRGNVFIDPMETAQGCVDAARNNARVALPSLVRAIDTDAWYRAVDCVRALAEYGDGGAFAALERAVKDARLPEARSQAAGALTSVAMIRDAQLVRVRRVLAHTKDPNIAWAIANALVAGTRRGRAAPGEAFRFELLRSILTHERATFRLRCLSTLEPLTSWAPLEDTLLDLLANDASPVVRMRVAELVRRKPLGLKWGLPLVRVCEADDPNVRLAAIETLLHWAGASDWPREDFAGWLAQRDAESPLADGTKRDPLRWARERADRGGGRGTSVLAVRKVHRFAPGHPDLLSTYLDWAHNQPEPMARAAAIEALARFDVTTPEVALELLSHVLRSDDNGWVRLAALRELPLLAPDDPRVLDLLADGLLDEQRDVRFIAASMLGVFAKPHARAEAALRAMCEDPDSSLAQMASSAIVAIGLGRGNPDAVPWGGARTRTEPEGVPR